jgi:hypothetical protein
MGEKPKTQYARNGTYTSPSKLSVKVPWTCS